MKYKVSKSNIAFTNGTLVLTVTLPYSYTLKREDILYLNNATQGVEYYVYGQATGSIASITAVGAINTITLTGVANLATNNIINLLLEIDDTTINLTTGVRSVQITNTPWNENDDATTIATQAPTASWALIGSLYTADTRNKHSIFIDIVIGSLDGLELKFFGRSKTSGNLFPINKISTDYTARLTASVDADKVQKYLVAQNASQRFVVDIDTDNNYSEIEVWQKATTSNIGAATTTIEVKKAFI